MQLGCDVSKLKSLGCSHAFDWYSPRRNIYKIWTDNEPIIKMKMQGLFIRKILKKKGIKRSNLMSKCKQHIRRVLYKLTRYSLIASYNNRFESCFVWMIDSTDSVMQGMLGKSWGTWVQRLLWSDMSAFFQIKFLDGWKILLLWVCAV